MKIQLKGNEILVDDDKMHIYNSRLWHVSDTGYVLWRGIDDGSKKTIRLHRLIIGANEGEIVDHINRNKLDNRLSNLRIISHKNNLRNSDRSEFAKGYYFDTNKKRWAVDYKLYNIKSIYVDSEQDAKDYIALLKNGGSPTRVFTRKPSLGSAKLTSEQRKMAFEMFEGGAKRYIIAKHFGVSPSAIGRLLDGTTWNNSGTISRRKPRVVLTEEAIETQSAMKVWWSNLRKRAN